MLVCTDPVLKFQPKLEYNTVLKLGAGNYNQYKRYQESLLSVAIGNIHPVIITAYTEDTTYAQATADKDLVAFLGIVRAVCTKNPNGGVAKYDTELHDLFYLKGALSHYQKKGQTYIDFADQMEDRYNAVVHLFGDFALGIKACPHQTLQTFPEYINLIILEQVLYK